MQDQGNEGEPEQCHELLAQDRSEPAAPQSWGGYSWYLVKKLGYGSLGGKKNPFYIWLCGFQAISIYVVINYLGEKLAYGLGITTPDWQYAIDIHEDMEREEKEEREAEERALREQREEVLTRVKEMEDARDCSHEVPNSGEEVLALLNREL